MMVVLVLVIVMNWNCDVSDRPEFAMRYSKYRGRGRRHTVYTVVWSAVCGLPALCAVCLCREECDDGVCVYYILS